MRLASAMALCGLMAAGCTTDRVATEFGDLKTAFDETKSAIEPKLAPGLEADRQAEISAAAANRDIWTLGNDCSNELATGVFLPSATCTLEKIRVGDRAPVIGEATALKRKLTVLSAYLGSLEALSDATLESDLNAAYATAVASFSDLSKAAELEDLTTFLAERQANAEKSGAVVSAAVSALRYKRMRSVVLASDEDVRQIVRESVLHALNLGVDPKLPGAVADLRAADQAVLLADSSDTAAYRAAMVALENKHSAFMTYYRGTLTYRLTLVAELHGKLAAALRSHGSAEDVVAYLESLRALSDLLKE
ncbi:hypothetical protein M4578_05340 [Salipiger sp. P9]|uniref:hypothetical protein n=1 Tax=Salipiger pentaromativorans TaxID=2943193 RepID=UPI00215705E0|nr:hypothetical protein [Salipiger pentaromativorans]MCR8547241.1 hypothetical protein [Salipiger pentaromativorans]